VAIRAGPATPRPWRRLCRRRRINDAKPVPTQALGTFRRLGARSWAQRAQAELRACGWRSPARPPNPGGQGVQVGGRVGFQGAVGGPEQARLAVAFGLGGDPAGRPFEGMVTGRAGLGRLLFPLGLQELGDGLPVEGAVGAGGLEELVGVLMIAIGGR
jgi:hypothetical protein